MFQMFTLLFSGHHIDVPWMHTNMVFSYWALWISEVWGNAQAWTHGLKLGEVSYLVICSVTSQFLSIFHWMVFDLFFYICVTMKMIYRVLISAILVSNRVWFLHSSLGLDTFLGRGNFFFIIDRTIKKSPSQIMFTPLCQPQWSEKRYRISGQVKNGEGKIAYFDQK